MIAYSTPAAILAVTVVLTVLCSILVILRFFARHPNGKKTVPDDWLCLAALVMTWAMAVSIIVGVANQALSYPVPHDSTAKEKFTEVEKLEWLVQMFQVLQLGFTKLSFVVLFRRIFAVHRKSTFAIATWAMIGLLVAWTVAFFFGFLFLCGGDFSRWWLHPQDCPGPGPGPGLAFENGFALSEVLIDFLIIMMPVPMIWRLHMTTQRKVAVTCIFALGTLAVIISIVRLVIFYGAKSAAVEAGVDPDQLITLILFWSVIESTVALTAACLPVTYNSFGKRIVESLVHSAHSLQSIRTRGSGSGSGHASHRSRPTGVSAATMQATTVHGQGPRRGNGETDMVPMVTKISATESTASFDEGSRSGTGYDERHDHRLDRPVILAETTIAQTSSLA